jgi:ATP-binding cassette subfamily B (MDR/TAP) protein 1
LTFLTSFFPPQIQDGLGRKFGDLSQFLSQIISAYAIAFYLNYKLAAVLLASLPIISCAGYFLIRATASASHKASEQYAIAGGLATEALSAVRTITALNMQPNVITRYRKNLFEALHVGMWKGLQLGIGNGGIFCASFLTYALGFWFGGNLVANDIANGCTHNCVTGMLLS